MNLFVEIHERNKDLDMQLSIATIETYKEKDIVDPDGTTHLCILYIINNGLRFEEEFNSSSDREAKMDLLEEYIDSGGGGEANLQIKDVTITENGDSVINPDSGYDGLKKVNVTTNVSGGGSDIDWSQIGYSSEPKALSDIPQKAFDEAKKLYDYVNTHSNITRISNAITDSGVDKSNFYVCPNLNMSKFADASTYRYAFQDCINLVDLPQLTSMGVSLESAFQQCLSLESANLGSVLKSNITACNQMFANSGIKNINVNGSDASNVTTFQNAFGSCKNLAAIDLSQLDTSNANNMSSMFGSCANLTSITLNGKFNTKKVTNFGNMFYSNNKLTHITFGENFTMEACTYINSMFTNTNQLDDETLNAIMGILITTTSAYTRAKTLKEVGISSINATKCQSLSNYQAFIDAGWTTGY